MRAERALQVCLARASDLHDYGNGSLVVHGGRRYRLWCGRWKGYTYPSMATETSAGRGRVRHVLLSSLPRRRLARARNLDDTGSCSLVHRTVMWMVLRLGAARLAVRFRMADEMFPGAPSPARSPSPATDSASPDEGMPSVGGGRPLTVCLCRRVYQRERLPPLRPPPREGTTFDEGMRSVGGKGASTVRLCRRIYEQERRGRDEKEPYIYITGRERELVTPPPHEPGSDPAGAAFSVPEAAQLCSPILGSGAQHAPSFSFFVGLDSGGTRVELARIGQPLAEYHARASRRRSTVCIALPDLVNGEDL
ncbi:hypothetical protein DFH06DRAFT_1343434 [Mycena polygramma]|nr:hypothetical protein DFH06DRAFT_1343434 [Mycena polygramma]